MSEMIEALAADGPHPDHADRLNLFGRFVGTWDAEVSFFGLDGTAPEERQPGEWRFGWVLEGRAIQDVLTSPLPEERADGAETLEYGTTLRIYDATIDVWRITWIAPPFGRVVNLIARPDSDEILLEGRAPNDWLMRWRFSEITDESFAGRATSQPTRVAPGLWPRRCAFAAAQPDRSARSQAKRRGFPAQPQAHGAGRHPLSGPTDCASARGCARSTRTVACDAPYTLAARRGGGGAQAPGPPQSAATPCELHSRRSEPRVLTG